MARIVHPTLAPLLASARDVAAGVVGTFDAAGNFIEIPAAGLVLDRAAGASRGLALFGQRTNPVANPRGLGPISAPTGWVIAAGASGISAQITGGAVLSGVPGVLIRYVGTATAAYLCQARFAAGSSIVAIVGEVWTLSAFVALVAGSLAGVTTPQIALAERNSSGVAIATTTAAAPPASGPIASTRYALTRTITPPATEHIAADWRATIPSGASVDFTVFVGAPMLERAAAVRPVVLPIAGGTSGGTVGAEDARALDPASLFAAPAGTIGATVDLGADTGNPRGVLRLGDGTPAERFDLVASAAGTSATIVADGVSAQCDGAGIAGGIARIAASYGPAGLALSVNGGAPVVASMAGLARLPIVSEALLGRLGPPGQSPLDGWLRRLRARPGQLLGSDLSSF